ARDRVRNPDRDLRPEAADGERSDPMHRLFWVALLLLLLVSCTSTSTSTGTSKAPRSRADVTVTAVSPAAQSAVGADTVFEADVAYRIESFQPDANRYFLTIQFEKADGGSFNHYRSFA